MSNPLLERYAERLRAANVYEKLLRHWSSRAYWPAMRLHCALERIAPSLTGLLTNPLLDFLEAAQSRFVLKHLDR